ncbi:MAG: YncE family protein [Pelobium sp.]
MKKSILPICILLCGMSYQALAQNTSNFHLLKSFDIKGDGGWDYLTVEEGNKLIYVSHGDQVNIIKEETGDSVGVIKNTNGVHGIGLVKALNKGYTTNGRSNNCTVFDLKNNEVMGTVVVGTNPDAILYDDYSKKIFVFNGRSNDASVIDPTTDKMIATIPLGGKPETGVSDGKGQIFVNVEDTNEVVVFDANTFKVKYRYKINDGDEPSGLALDRITHRLFIGCGGNQTLVVMDATNGKNIAHFPIGNCDGVAFDPIYKMAYASNGNGFISMLKEKDANTFELLKNIPTEAGARTIAIDTKTHHIFTSTAKSTPVAPTAENAHPRPKLIPGTFHVLDIGN